MNENDVNMRRPIGNWKGDLGRDLQDLIFMDSLVLLRFASNMLSLAKSVRETSTFETGSKPFPSSKNRKMTIG